jgi:hypothetical protein
MICWFNSNGNYVQSNFLCFYLPYKMKAHPCGFYLEKDTVSLRKSISLMTARSLIKSDWKIEPNVYLAPKE